MLVFEFYILCTLILYHQCELLLNNWLYLSTGHSGTRLKPQHLEASLGYLQVRKKKTEALSGLVATPKSLPTYGKAHPLQSLAS